MSDHTSQPDNTQEPGALNPELQTERKTSYAWLWWTIGILLLFALGYFLFQAISGPDTKEKGMTDTLQEVNQTNQMIDSLKKVAADLDQQNTDQYFIINTQNDSIKKLATRLDECRQSNCGKGSTKATKSASKQAAKPAQQQQFKPVQQSVAPQPVVKTATTRISPDEEYIDEATSTGMPQYQGIKTGDFGCTISSDSRLLYYLKDGVFEGVGTPEVEQQGVYYPMTLQNGWWIWESKTKLSESMLRLSQEWAIRYGKDWLPHGFVKPILIPVLGRDWGKITDEDVRALGEYDPNIKKGFFLPNGYYATVEGKDWYGWKFRMPPYYKKVN